RNHLKFSCSSIIVKKWTLYSLTVLFSANIHFGSSYHTLFFLSPTISFFSHDDTSQSSPSSFSTYIFILHNSGSRLCVTLMSNRGLPSISKCTLRIPSQRIT